MTYDECILLKWISFIVLLDWMLWARGHYFPVVFLQKCSLLELCGCGFWIAIIVFLSFYFPGHEDLTSPLSSRVSPQVK